MEKTEVQKILSVLKVNYPASYRNLTRDDGLAMIELWHRQFQEYNYATVLAAVDSIISTDVSDFAPSIGKIKSMIIKLTEPDDGMTEAEAWALVVKAVRRSNYHAAEEFNKLPEVIQRLVGSPAQLREWALMDVDQVNTVVSSNFMRSYRVRAKNEREMLALPNHVKEILQIGVNSMKMIE